MGDAEKMMKAESKSRNVWYLVNRAPYMSWKDVELELGVDPGKARGMYLRENLTYVAESWLVAWGRLFELVRNTWSVVNKRPRLKDD